MFLVKNSLTYTMVCIRYIRIEKLIADSNGNK